MNIIKNLLLILFIVITYCKSSIATESSTSYILYEIFNYLGKCPGQQPRPNSCEHEKAIESSIYKTTDCVLLSQNYASYIINENSTITALLYYDPSCTGAHDTYVYENATCQYTCDYHLGTSFKYTIIDELAIPSISINEILMLIGSFAASAVLIFAAPKAPLSQPRCLIGGNIISSIIGCAIRVALVYTEANFETACVLAVSVSILVMHLTTTLHPPGGATALICVMSTEQRWRGSYFVLVPVASGAFIMLITALIINNFDRRRSYPVYW